MVILRMAVSATRMLGPQSFGARNVLMLLLLTLIMMILIHTNAFGLQSRHGRLPRYSFHKGQSSSESECQSAWEDFSFGTIESPPQQPLIGSPASGATTKQIDCQRRSMVNAIAFLGVSLSYPRPSSSRNLPETYATSSNPGSLESLVPLVRMEHELLSLIDQVQSLIAEQKRVSNSSVDNGKLQQMLREFPTRILGSNAKTSKKTTNPNLVGTLPTEESQFKALFDAYSEPVSYKTKFLDQNAFLVYYTQGYDGPGRPSLEQVETESDAKQKRQFGARNEAWVAWDDVVAAATEWSHNPKLQEQLLLSGDNKNNEILEQDFLEPLQQALEAVQRYLKDAPSKDVDEARSQLL